MATVSVKGLQSATTFIALQVVGFCICSS